MSDAFSGLEALAGKIEDAMSALDAAVWQAKRAADALGVELVALGDLERDVERWATRATERVDAINEAIRRARPGDTP